MAHDDEVLTAAVDLARAAAEEIAEPGTVGEHQGFELEGERVGTHSFDCTSPAYRGWRWAVTVARPPRARTATIDEIHLLPGIGALLAPIWLPWSDRIAPGDLGPGDLLPIIVEDPRLEPGYEATDDEDADQLAFWELGLGRERVLSPEGRAEAAERWYEGPQGPHTPVAELAPAPCHSCGFFLPMAGTLRAVFGVCSNEWSPNDGQVVSLDHGCGAHSQGGVTVEAPQAELPILDELGYDALLLPDLPSDLPPDAHSDAPSEVELDAGLEPVPDPVPQ
jgi:Protein of unknown function (DUF3027)